MRMEWIKTAAIGVLLGGPALLAQTAVTTGGGTTYRIPKFSGNYTLVDSVLSENNGDLLVGGNPFGFQFSSANQLIGTIGGNQTSFSMQANSVYDTSATGGLFFMGGSQRTDGLRSQALILGNSTNFYPVPGTQTGVLVDGSSGVNTVGIGMASGSHPGAQLEVNGGIKLSYGSNGSITFPDGSVQTTSAWSSSGTLNVGTNTGGWQTPALINIGGSNDVGLALGTAHYGTLMGTVEGPWFNIINPFVIQPGGTSPADHPIVLTTVQNNPTNGLVIQNSGNIGIGTISPASRLEVSGDIRLSAGSNGKVIFPDGSSLSSASNLTSGGGGSSTASFPDITDSNGNVGIGTASPQSQLTVQNGINIDQGSGNSGAINNGSASGNGLTFGPGSGEGIASNRSGSSINPFGLDFYTEFIKRMSITQGGYVGIGTTSPQEKLHVAVPSLSEFSGTDAAFIGSNFNLQGTDSGRTVGNGPSLSFSFPANSDGTNTWEQARIMASPDNTNTGDARGRMYLQVRDLYNPGSGGTWNWRTGLMIQANGNTGIGTTSPGAKLEVNGGIKLSNGSNGSIIFPDGSQLSTASISNTGSVVTTKGGGTIGGAYVSQNVGGKNVYLWGGGSDGTNYTGGNIGGAVAFNGSNYIVGTDGGSNGGWMLRSTGEGDNIGIYTIPSTGGNIQTIAPGNIESFRRVTLANDGSLGVGTAAPGAKLEVNGNVKLTANSGASMTFQDGSIQTVAWNGTTLGGDYAESVDVLGDRSGYEPGDVIVIDGEVTGKFDKSSTSYSRMVAGVYSTKPGLVGRRTTADRPDKAAEVPMAMMGIVPTKVSTENGPIQRGDLLVSSSTPGYAMKGTERDRLTGAIIGKALAPLKSGSGVIEVLLSLQ